MIREGSVPVASGTVWPGDYSLPDPYSVTIGTLPAPAVSNRMSFQGAAAFFAKILPRPGRMLVEFSSYHCD
jgi:hypothetical protein